MVAVPDQGVDEMTHISFIAIGDRPESYSMRLLKALVESKGYTANLIYLNIGHLYGGLTFSPELQKQLVALVKDSSVVCLNVLTFNCRLAVDVTDLIRNRMNPLIVWGGAHAIAVPKECAEHADIVVINEGEEVLLEIISRYLRYGRSFSKTDIPNIAYQSKNLFIRNKIQRLPFGLDDIPFQDYSLNNHFFVNDKNELAPLTFRDVLNNQGGAFSYITMYSRGCPHHCNYCLNSNPCCIPFYIGRSVDNVIQELVNAKEQFKDTITKIVFYDDDFFALPLGKIRDFSAKYKEKVGLPIHPLNASVSNFREDKLLLLRDAGAMGVIVGIQTVSQRGRWTYQNPATKENILKIVNVMQKYPDQELIFHLILGNPYENDDDIAENLLFLNSLPKIYQLSVYQLIIYPGTKLHEMVKNDPVHSHRANEGYRIPYYYRKPELILWNFLATKYLGKRKPFPDYIRYLIEHKHYALLNLLVQPWIRNKIDNAIRIIPNILFHWQFH
jgi:anaerobic magnesium-protoporphyrin IX monomethyl ester cyclase